MRWFVRGLTAVVAVALVPMAAGEGRDAGSQLLGAVRTAWFFE
jgi:hypothetical protein